MYTDSKIWRCDGTFTFPQYTMSKVISTGIATLLLVLIKMLHFIRQTILKTIVRPNIPAQLRQFEVVLVCLRNLHILCYHKVLPGNYCKVMDDFSVERYILTNHFNIFTTVNIHCIILYCPILQFHDIQDCYELSCYLLLYCIILLYCSICRIVFQSSILLCVL